MDREGIGGGFLAAVAVIVVIAIFIAACVGGCGVYKGWQRGQSRANAQNQVQITRIQLQNIRAQNQVVAAQAHQRYLESVGVRAAQDEISKTLTPAYLQYEAIKAEQAVATSGQNNTVVYLPSGPMGVPLVQNATHPGTTK